MEYSVNNDCEEIMKEPTNSAEYGSSAPAGVKHYTVYFKDYKRFDYLPAVVQNEETKAEYDAWWKWYRKHGDK